MMIFAEKYVDIYFFENYELMREKMRTREWKKMTIPTIF